MAGEATVGAADSRPEAEQESGAAAAAAENLPVKRRDQLDTLHGLRFFAAFGIVVLHACNVASIRDNLTLTYVGDTPRSCR